MNRNTGAGTETCEEEYWLWPRCFVLGDYMDTTEGLMAVVDLSEGEDRILLIKKAKGIALGRYYDIADIRYNRQTKQFRLGKRSADIIGSEIDGLAKDAGI